MSASSLLAPLKWRYATKLFDSTRKIPAAEWECLEDALVLSPSSFGLQPYKFAVITDQSIKEKLVPFSWGQRQPADCSHYVVFAARLRQEEADVDRYLSRISEMRGDAAESLAGYRKMLLSFVRELSEDAAREWATRQAYIALGNFMTAAAMIGIDTCPMEGLEPASYDALLGLSARGCQTVVACAAGYRASDDKYATLAKVRLPASELVLRI